MQRGTLADWAARAGQAGVSIGELALRDQAAESEQPSQAVYDRMDGYLTVMAESVAAGMARTERTDSGLSGGEAAQMMAAIAQGRLADTGFHRTIAMALAVAGCNAGMGRVVAAPTAGACGILPAVVIGAAQEHGLDRRTQVLGLFAAGAIGEVIARHATISGAQGGCQAECGAASAMAAGALCQMLGGGPEQVIQAAGIALKNLLGLVCDPVGGLVECPCVKRNAGSAANALAAAAMALAGIQSVIPPDEVIAAMKRVGEMMPAALRETAEGGLAATPTGRRIAKTLR